MLGKHWAPRLCSCTRSRQSQRGTYGGNSAQRRRVSTPLLSLQTWGRRAGTRVGCSSEVEIRFCPKAWAWRGHRQTRKWGSRRVSGRVETWKLPALSGWAVYVASTMGPSAISINPTTRLRVSHRQEGGAAGLARLAESLAATPIQLGPLFAGAFRHPSTPRFMLPLRRQPVRT